VRGAAVAAGLHLGDTAVAHPGVDPGRFAPAPAREWAGRLLCLGRVDPRKGVGVAIGALAQLPGATLTVDGPAEPGHSRELEDLARARGVTERVRFTDSAPAAVPAAYAEADAVLFPVTWAEPWGLVPLEAMAVGRPVVATGTGGSGEYLRAGVNALLTTPGDAGELAAAVRRLAGDADLRARLVAGGRRTAAGLTAAAFEGAVVAAVERAAA
jgi:glycosyltransferase involved in cell wall biosynthesis